jgi:hypothetical protein
MALTNHTRRQLAVALGSESLADQVADIVDAGSGTLSDDAKRRIWNMLGSTATGVVLATAIAGDTTLTSYQKDKLTRLLGATALADVSSHQSG